MLSMQNDQDDLIILSDPNETIVQNFTYSFFNFGNFCQKKWESVYEWFDGDAFSIAILGSAIVTISVFWLSNAFFLIVDYFGCPSVLLKYKVQEDKNVPVDPIKLRKAILLVIFNQTVVSALVMVVFYYLMSWRGCSFGNQLPSLIQVAWELIVFIFVEEIGFYYSHRFLHRPTIYKHVHKIHHEWTAPISVVSIYAHPLEHVISNLLPALMGPLICGSHIVTAWLWYSIALSTTTISHCGYHLPFFQSPEAHDYHHLKFNQNFGILGLLDWLHGTNTIFKKSKQYERDYLMMSLIPTKQQVPDSPKKEN